MARYECQRCRAVLNTTMPPHLCKDVAARLKEAERALAREECPPRPRAGGLEGWLKKMDALDPAGRNGPRFKSHDWAIDHHGAWVDLCHPRTPAS